MKTKEFQDMRIYLDESSGIEDLIEYQQDEYPEFDESENFNSGVSRLVNELLPNLEPDEEIPPYRARERAYDENHKIYDVPIALSVESQEALKANLAGEQHTRYRRILPDDGPLSAHLKRVVQYYACELASHERVGTEERNGEKSLI